MGSRRCAKPPRPHLKAPPSHRSRHIRRPITSTMRHPRTPRTHLLHIRLTNTTSNSKWSAAAIMDDAVVAAVELWVAVEWWRHVTLRLSVSVHTRLHCPCIVRRLQHPRPNPDRAHITARITSRAQISTITNTSAVSTLYIVTATVRDLLAVYG